MPNDKTPAPREEPKEAPKTISNSTKAVPKLGESQNMKAATFQQNPQMEEFSYCPRQVSKIQRNWQTKTPKM